jgi:hypothetical protein
MGLPQEPAEAGVIVALAMILAKLLGTLVSALIPRREEHGHTRAPRVSAAELELRRSLEDLRAENTMLRDELDRERRARRRLADEKETKP